MPAGAIEASPPAQRALLGHGAVGVSMQAAAILSGPCRGAAGAGQITVRTAGLGHCARSLTRQRTTLALSGDWYQLAPVLVPLTR